MEKVLTSGFRHVSGALEKAVDTAFLVKRRLRFDVEGSSRVLEWQEEGDVMSLNPLVLLEKIVNEHGSAAILKERIELFRDSVQLLQDTKAQLERENETLRKQVEQLQKQAERQQRECDSLNQKLDSLSAQQADYVKHRGALFLVEGGKVETTVYCPKCESPMSSLANHLPFRCHCGYTVGFASDVMNGVLKEVREKAGVE